MTMSKIEGFISLSSLEKRSASKFHLFILVNVFLGSVIAGTALQQLKQFIEAPTGEYVAPL
jgi:cation transporter-like permease